jgi:hypothetical protein
MVQTDIAPHVPSGGRPTKPIFIERFKQITATPPKRWPSKLRKNRGLTANFASGKGSEQ